MNAAALLREARSVGVDLELVGDRARFVGNPEPDLRARLKAHRSEVLEILFGNRCRTCAVSMGWPNGLGLMFADGSAECMRCADGEVERLLAAGRRAADPDLGGDPAEAMVRGEIE